YAAGEGQRKPENDKCGSPLLAFFNIDTALSIEIAVIFSFAGFLCFRSVDFFESIAKSLGQRRRFQAQHHSVAYTSWPRRFPDPFNFSDGLNASAHQHARYGPS